MPAASAVPDTGRRAAVRAAAPVRPAQGRAIRHPLSRPTRGGKSGADFAAGDGRPSGDERSRGPQMTATASADHDGDDHGGRPAGGRLTTFGRPDVRPIRPYDLIFPTRHQPMAETISQHHYQHLADVPSDLAT